MLMRCAAALVGVRMTNSWPCASVRRGCTRVEEREGVLVSSPRPRECRRAQRSASSRCRRPGSARAATYPRPREARRKKNGPPNSLSRCAATSASCTTGKLVEVAEQEEPHAAEGLAWAPRLTRSASVDRPHEIGADHRDLVDDEGEAPHHRAVAAAADILGADEARRQAEERVDRLPADVDGGEPRRREHHRLVG